MDDASRFLGVQRRNVGWLFVLDDDLRIIAGPDAGAELPADIESQVHRATARWAPSLQHELLMSLGPALFARVFAMHGPDGACVAVYVERFHERVEDRILE
ncbi:MAG: hypothetical protein WBD74_08080 [Candidatus Aquilonibacter sp.]